MGFINFFVTKLSTDVGAADTTITLDTMPLYPDGSPVTSGRLVLEARNVSQREIIKFTNVSGNTITGVSRGQGGTTARSHISGSVVEMNLTAEDLIDAINVPNDIISRFDDVVEDYVNNGLVVSQTSGLVGKITLGVAYISGYRVNKSADTTGINFVASKDIYVDMDSSGNFYYNDVPNNTAMPAMVADRIRLARVVTDGSAITAVYNFDNRGSRLTGYNILREADNDYLVPNTVTYKGNRSYELVFNGVDYTQKFSEGMRLRAMRTVPAPIRSLILNGTNQYMSRTSAVSLGTFTDDFASGAWVYLTSYQNATIIGRFNGSSGWQLAIDSSGRPVIIGYNANSANFSEVKAYQSIPLNKWVYVSAQLDMSAFTATTTTSYIMIDGVDVPAVCARGGTNPTALVQAGDLQIGALNGSNFFPGYIAQSWYSSAKVPQANIPGIISQGLTSAQISANNIISAYSFDNTPNDLNISSGNNLTPQNSAGYVVDSPFAGGARSYDSAGLVEHCAVSIRPVFSTNTTVTVQVPEGHSLPTTGGIVAISLSSQAKPYGFPSDISRWAVATLTQITAYQGAPVAATWYLPTQGKLILPAGSWKVNIQGATYGDRGGAGLIDTEIALCTNNTSSTANTGNIPELSNRVQTTTVDTIVTAVYNLTATYIAAAATALYRKVRFVAAGGTNVGDSYVSGISANKIEAIPNFL